MRILFVSANDPENYLDIEREQRALLKLAESGGHFLKFFPAAQIDDLKDLLSTTNGAGDKFDVLHFAGHGEKKGLLLRSEFDGSEHQELSGEVLKEFLEAVTIKDRVKLVVLNACETEDVAEEIADVVNAVIGTREKVKDRTARSFSSDFYDELNDGSTVSAAYETATVIDNDSPYLRLGSNQDWTAPKASGNTEIEGLGTFYASFYGGYIDEQIGELRQDMRLNTMVFWGLLAVAVCMWIYLLNVDSGVFWPNLVDAVKAAFYPDETEFSITGIWDRVQALDTFAPILIAFFQRRIFSHGTPRLDGLQRLKEAVEQWDDLPVDEQEMVRSVMHTSLVEALKDDK